MKDMLEQLKLKEPMVRLIKEKLKVKILAFALDKNILKKFWVSKHHKI